MPQQLEKRRRQAIQLLQEGMHLSAVARWLGAAKSSVSRWAHAYEQHGVNGLRPTPIPGRPPRLSPAQKAKLVALLWDRGPIHRRREVQIFLRDRPRVQWDYFPAYASELNPAEYVWTQTDAALSDSAPQDLVDLKARLRSSIRRTRSSQQLLLACIYASDSPWPR